MKRSALQASQHPEVVEPRRNSEGNGHHPPLDGFDEATNVMESGLLRVLTDESARENAPPSQQPIQNDEMAAVTSAAPPRRRSRLFVIAGVVAATVLAFDAWLLSSHPRKPARPPAAAPVTSSGALPTYMLLPLESSPSPTPPPSTPPAPTSTTVAEEAVPATSPPATHRHKHGHHRHSTP